MRIVLEVLSGPAAGRKSLLGACQVLKVGRSEWADFAVPRDRHMSGVHFELETDNAACYVTDLGSSNGTRLNDRPVETKSVVRNGDEILAGHTVFTVRTESETLKDSTAVDLPTGAAGPAVAPGQPAEKTPQRRGKVNYTIETCDSGLTLCRGTVEEIKPTDLAALFSQEIPLYLIVDFNRAGVPPPEELDQPDYLFDWLDPAAAALVSPVVLAHGEFAEWPGLVESGWGNDAVICLFSNYEKSALLEHLRTSARTKPKGDNQDGGVLGYCWPSVMALLLAHNSPDFVRKLLTGIDAVLVELPDLPDTWQVYGQAPVAHVLDELGFVRQAREKVSEEVGGEVSGEVSSE